MQDVDFHAVQVGHLGPCTFDGIRQGIMDDVCCSVSIVNQQGEIERFPEKQFTTSNWLSLNTPSSLSPVLVMPFVRSPCCRFSLTRDGIIAKGTDRIAAANKLDVGAEYAPVSW